MARMMISIRPELNPNPADRKLARTSGAGGLVFADPPISAPVRRSFFFARCRKSFLNPGTDAV